MDKDQQIERLRACVQEHQAWHDTHAVWIQDIKRWRQLEQQMTGLVHELGQAIPSHHRELERHGSMIQNHTHQLQQHSQDCQNVRIQAKNTDQCATELDHLQRFAQSDCLDCDEHCIAALLTIHQQLADAHAAMSRDHAHFTKESETSMQTLTTMLGRLITCLEK